MAAGIEAAPARVVKLEEALSKRGNAGPYFAGDSLCLVDAAYAPFLQRFAFAESKLQTGVLANFPLVQAWSDALMANDRVLGSVAANFEDEFIASLKRRGFHVGSLFASAAE
jgi:glutathione S-transferase